MYARRVAARRHHARLFGEGGRRAVRHAPATDLVARVIKVEHPEAGDLVRGFDTIVKDHSNHFVWLNRFKEFLTLGLKQDSAKEVLGRSVERTTSSSRTSLWALRSISALQRRTCEGGTRGSGQQSASVPEVVRHLQTRAIERALGEQAGRAWPRRVHHRIGL